MPIDKKSKNFKVMDGEGISGNGDNLFVPACDPEGHSVRGGCRMPKQLKYQIGMLVKSNNFPLKSEGEVIRAALVSFLNRAVVEYPVPSVMMQVEVIKSIMLESQFNTDFLKVFDSLSETVSKLQSENSVGQALRIVMEVRQKILKMPEGYWRDKYLEALDGRYGYLIDGGKATGLTKVDDEKVNNTKER